MIANVIDHSHFCFKEFKVFTKKCPRCGNVNFNISVNDGWIEWQVPLISKKNPIANSIYHSRKCAGQFQVNAEASQTDADGNGAIASPASYVTLFFFVEQLITIELQSNRRKLHRR